MADEEETQQEETSTAEETADASTEEADTSEQTEETSEETEDSSSQEVQPDYQKQLEKERQRRLKAEKALAEDRYHTDKKKDDTEEGGSEEDRPPTKSELEQMFRQYQTETERRLMQDKVEEKAKQMSSSETERDLVLEIYNNRLQPTGDIDEDIEMAHAIANRERLQRQNQELAKKASEQVSNKSVASSTKKVGHKEPGNLNEGTKNFLRQYNMQWNSKTGRYEGQYSAYDPKSDQTVPLQ